MLLNNDGKCSNDSGLCNRKNQKDQILLCAFKSEMQPPFLKNFPKEE